MQNSLKEFTVTLVNQEKGIDKTVQISNRDYILDMAEKEGINLPYSCRAASCFDCLGKVLEGEVEQTDKATSFLKPAEIKEGYVLLCAACPASNCKILTHQAEDYLA